MLLCIEQTSLMYAASRGHKHIAQLLLQYGADVNAKTSTG